MAEWVVEPFGRGHDRAGFTCGRPTLDEFIRAQVSQYERRLGRTYVAIRPGSPRVIGYYTLAAGSVGFASLTPDAARKLPRHPVPVVVIARLAVATDAQGAGLGEGLLLDALHRVVQMSVTLGVHAVEVDAIDDRAAAFYRRYGFVPLVDEPLHLYLPVTAAAAAGPA